MKYLLKKPLVILILFGIIYRIIVVYFYQHITLFPDSEGYQMMAKMISELDFSGYEGQRSPGYPSLLALANNNLVFLIGIQLIIGIFNSVLTYQNLKLLKFTPGYALLIALLLDGLLHVVFYEQSILTESLTLFLISSTANILLRNYFDKSSIKTEILLGSILAYLVLVKPFYVFLPFIIYGFCLLKSFRLKTFINQRLIVLIIPITAFLGWCYVNKIYTGYFVPTTFYGYNMSQNCVYFAQKAPNEYKLISEIYVHHREETIRNNGDVAMTIWSAYPDLKKATGLSFSDLSFELNQFSKATIKKNPVDYLNQVKTSWLDFWRTAIYWQSDKFKNREAASAFIWIWELQHSMLRFFKILFLLNIPLLLVAFIKKRHFSIEIILSSIIVATSLLQAFSTFGTNSRFSYPFEIMMIIVVLLQVKSFLMLRKSKKKPTV